MAKFVQGDTLEVDANRVTGGPGPIGVDLHVELDRSLNGLPLFENQEQVTARTLPLCAPQPTVLLPSVPPPQAPVPFEDVPPLTKLKFAPWEPQVLAAWLSANCAPAATEGAAPAASYRHVALPDIHLKPLVT